MITLTQAQHLADTYHAQGGSTWFEREVIEKETFWCFRVGFIGSAGIIIDKADGKLSVLGSALSLDDAFWGHEHGFSSESVTLHISKVYDVEQATSLLFQPVVNYPTVKTGPTYWRDKTAKRKALAAQLQDGPCQFGPLKLWLLIPYFRQAQQLQWFDFHLTDYPTP